MERPNIILILADDMGYSDLGYFGSEIATPNLDTLAAGGVLFNQFYNAGRCCPTRASLMTGLYSHQAGVGDMIKDLGHPSYLGYLNQNCRTIAELLSDQGYQTMMVGKWHLGDNPDHWPQKRGFEKFYGIPQGGGVYYYPWPKKDRNVVLNDHILEVDSGYYVTHGFNEYAVRFVEQAKDDKRPFFLYLPHIAPHFPLQAPQEAIEKYRGRFSENFEEFRKKRHAEIKRKGILSKSWKMSPADSLVKNWENLSDEEMDDMDLRMSIYAAQMEIMDQGIGDLIESLKRTEQLDNTIIFFLSDNGATAENMSHRYPELTGSIGNYNSYETYGRSWANVSNTPFRYYKSFLYEGGISTPLIAYAPSMFGQERMNDAITHVVDLVPTMLDLAGAEYTSDAGVNPLSGMSFASQLTGGNSKNVGSERTLFWEHEGDRAVRKGAWKLVSIYPENKWRLYNLKEDRTELVDKSSQNPELVTELETIYQDWANEHGVLDWAEVPVIKERLEKRRKK